MILALFLTAPEPIQLNLPVGTVIESTLKLEYTEPDSGFRMVTEDQFRSTVKAITSEEVTFEQQITPVSLTMDDFVRPMGNPKPSIATEIRTRKGALKSFDGLDDDPETNLEQARLRSIPLPRLAPNVGSDWEFVDNREPIPFRFNGQVMLEAPTQIEVSAKITPRRQPDPFEATGRVLLDLKTGWPKRIQWTVKHARSPGDEGERMNLKYTWETQEIKIPSR